MTTKRIVDGGVTTQYDQKIVRLMSRSNASPDAACVICASVSAGGDAISSTFDTTNTGLHESRRHNYQHLMLSRKRKKTHSSKTFCTSYLVAGIMSGRSTSGVMIILARIATTTVLVSPALPGFRADTRRLPPSRLEFFDENTSRTLSSSDVRDAVLSKCWCSGRWRAGAAGASGGE